MKKWGMILLALVLAMSLTACGQKADGARNAPAEDADKSADKTEA